MRIGYYSVIIGVLGLVLILNLQYKAFLILQEILSSNGSNEIITIGKKFDTSYPILIIGILGFLLSVIGIRHQQKHSRLGLILNLICIISVFIPLYIFLV